MLTQEQLKELLQYDQDTGCFTYIKSRKSIRVGEVAGHTHKSNGYRFIAINGKRYSEHRLAWLYVYGAFPPNDIDHINRMRSDNRISNLRAATRSENLQNQTKRRNNTSGYTGVAWNKNRQKWQVYLSINQRSKYLGSFESQEQAVAVHMAAKTIHHPFHTTL